MIDLNKMLDRCNWFISEEKREMQKWIERLQFNPVDAFEWSDRAFQTAARLHMIEYLKSYVEYGLREKVTLAEEEVRMSMMKEFFRRSSKIGGSTSVGHNTMDKFLVEAYSDFLHTTGYGLNFNLHTIFRSCTLEEVKA